MVSALALVAVLLCLEGATRLLTDIPQPLDYRDLEVGKTYIPGFADRVYVEECDCRIDIRFNREGFRGADVAIEKPAGVRRVAVLGDSMIAAIATPEPATMVSRLEALLNEFEPQTTWQVQNFGVSGSSTAQELLLYRRRVRAYQPDVVVLAFYVGNDLADNSNELSTNPRIYFKLADDGSLVRLPFSVGRAKRSAWVNRYSRFYVWQKQAVARIAESSRVADGATFVYASDPAPPAIDRAWKLTERLVAELARDVQADGARFVVVEVPAAPQVYDDRWAEVVGRAGVAKLTVEREMPTIRLQRICDGLGLPFLRLLDGFRRFAPHASSDLLDERAYFGGRSHFNPAGNEVAAKTLYEQLRPLIGEID
jgi:hypothetical protein